MLAAGAALAGMAALAALAGAAPLAAQEAAEGGPWFGLPLPPGLEPHALQVISERPAVPAIVPAGEERFTELSGESLWADLVSIVEFSKESRATREIGSGQLWGRVTGLPSGNRTVAWAVNRLREAGIADVELQRFDQDEGASIWLPLSWEVRLLGDPAFGPGSQDVVLESAMPLSGEIPPEGITAPVVFVGSASPAELRNVDVRGKVAVQKAIPQGHTVFVRTPVGPRAESLLERGAVAVLTIVDLPGNVRSRDMGCGGGLCFNLGGRDGLFLESVLNRLAESGSAAELRVHLSLQAERRSGLSGANGVAIIPGTSRPDEYVVLDAHADAWFDGAGDNADGLAVLLALARHFARPEIRLERSLVFVVSAGHHSSGLSGPGHFVAMNPEIAENAVLVVNLEHTSQRHITPARSESEDGYCEWTMDAHEAPIVAGVTNSAPFLEDLVARGIERYGTNFVSGPNTMASGEGGTYRRLGAPVFTTMQGPPMYHTTGEVLEMVSRPGMERMARFMAWFLEEVSRAPAAQLEP
ncbi:MAG TPA: M28 family peptidase [Longimicrobiales bacterium]|nr:M28 family peptidase [Longimicrobiales bacterium]